MGDIALAGTATGVIAQTQGSSGYIKIPAIIGSIRKELIIQWYTAVASGSGFFDFNFPIPFPNAFLADACMPGGSGAAVVNGGTVTKTKRQLFCNAQMSVAVITVGW